MARGILTITPDPELVAAIVALRAAPEAEKAAAEARVEAAMAVAGAAERAAIRAMNCGSCSVLPVVLWSPRRR